jgi:hypothetical protein
MSHTTSAAQIFEPDEQAEKAVKTLQEVGVDVKSLSITGDRMKYWGKVVAFWGGVRGLLFGFELSAVTGLEPILIAGPLSGWIMSVLEGTDLVGDVNSIGTEFVSIGIPKHKVIRYKSVWKSNKSLFIVHGTRGAVYAARIIPNGTGRKSHDFVASTCSPA